MIPEHIVNSWDKICRKQVKRRNPIPIALDKFHTEMANDIALFIVIRDFARSRKDWRHRTLQRMFRFSHRIPCLSCWKALLHVAGHKNSPGDSLADWLRKNKNHRRNLTLIASDGLLPLINALCDYGKVHCLHFFWRILKSGWRQLLLFYIWPRSLPMIYTHRFRKPPE